MEPARAISWEAPEHTHNEKGGDWYLALAILVISIAVAAYLFDNILFSLLVVVAGGAMALAATKKPSIIPFGVSVRGIRIDERLYPYSTLQAYHIDEDHPDGPQLLVLSKQKMMPILVLPLPEDYIDDVEDILREKLAEELIEEPLFMILLEKFGF
ncbi:MAG TPA: hypothetical protein PKA42_00140 [Candidatus Paceibacterota bacterium]|nr:hypothetical protein [Candidatus Paceibacterota bacterium]HMO82555.1 hypothetical protein [Candidatus Paceibacterota bacterium]